MIPHPFRHKGGAPQLGAHRPGESGPFGRRPDPDLDEDDDQDDEPDETSTN
ncbi:hypothetical protein ACIRVK_13725 [Streptomyces sp. NPDC101152]|uniref:hypothetical protein n=1 Tax=Streptomyces sp. NPDC101152 TaxID=3366116 RepID=UPI00380C08C4